MIRSKCLITIFDIISLTHKEEKLWPDGIHPMLFAESSCVCMPKFYACSSILFSGESTIFVFCFLIQEGVWPYKYAYDIPLMTKILNIYGFVGLAPYFLQKNRQTIRTL